MPQQSMSNAQQRVLRACRFEQPDRVPRFESFRRYPESWRQQLGGRDGLTDVAIWYPDETPFSSRSQRLKEESGYIYEIDSWGRTLRRATEAHFVETLQNAIGGHSDLEKMEFDPPDFSSRYLTGKSAPAITFSSQGEMEQSLRVDKRKHCVFGRTGGPFACSTYLRGESEFLNDIVADPSFAQAIAEKITDHLIGIGRQELCRWDLYETGIWIYDDMADNNGPMLSPTSFEQVFLPSYRRMISAFKSAGASYVFLHSNGDIRGLLDMLIDAGIDGLHPLERLANMDMASIRHQYPKLILVGGMCSARTLVRGTAAEIEAEASEIIDLGRNGGVILGTDSVNPEIPLKNFLIYHECCLRHDISGLRLDSVHKHMESHAVSHMHALTAPNNKARLPLARQNEYRP